MDVTAAEARQRLIEGNERFRQNRGQGPGLLRDRHASMKEGQAPFAVILACADSRVAPEILFDTGLGELFVVRVAGNVANPSTIASIEFAVSQLGTKFVVVLGHEKCGAVGAAIAGRRASKSLGVLLDFIEPAVEGGTVDETAVRNAHLQLERILTESTIVRESGAEVVSGFFHIETGTVELD
jgi:carbonic anhydrase